MAAFPPHPKSTLTVTLVALALGVCEMACGDSSDVVMAKPAPSVQCAPSQTTQVKLDAEVAALQAVGASVSSRSCGNSGNVTPAVCGYGRGDLWIISVSQASVSIASSHGFSAITRFPSAQKKACADTGG